jgi:hypothetical protein
MRGEFINLMIDGTSFQATCDSLREIPLFDAFFQEKHNEKYNDNNTNENNTIENNTIENNTIESNTTNEEYNEEYNEIIYVDRDYDLFEKLYTSILYSIDIQDISNRVKSEFEYYGITENNDEEQYTEKYMQ